MIHCAICFCDKGEFYQQAYIAVLSCFLHTNSSIHLHIVINDTESPHLSFFRDLCEKYGNQLTVHAPPVIPKDVRGLFRNLHYTEASLYRLCLHELCDVDRMVYFDCDIVFKRDVADLAAVDLSSAWIAATHDPERRWSRRKFGYYIQRLNIDADRYFNSGVLVLNLKNLRQASAEAGANVFWQAYRDLAPLAPSLAYDIYDQDMLNAFLSRDHERLVLLDASTFNYELCLHKRRFLKLEELDGKILHYCALKPWMKFFPVHLAYWQYDAMSPWGDSTFARMSERIQDPEDKWMRVVFDVWKNPKRYRWLYWLSRLWSR